MGDFLTDFLQLRTALIPLVFVAQPANQMPSDLWRFISISDILGEWNMFPSAAIRVDETGPLCERLVSQHIDERDVFYFEPQKRRG